MIKHGFLIRNGEIYDTKILSYKLYAKHLGNNIIYEIKSDYYKRLYFFEALLLVYDVDKVFEILRLNSTLKKDRHNETSFRNESLRYASNMAVLFNYPPTYLNKKKYNLYRICLKLKAKLD